MKPSNFTALKRSWLSAIFWNLIPFLIAAGAACLYFLVQINYLKETLGVHQKNWKANKMVWKMQADSTQQKLDSLADIQREIYSINEFKDSVLQSLLLVEKGIETIEEWDNQLIEAYQNQLTKPDLETKIEAKHQKIANRLFLIQKNIAGKKGLDIYGLLSNNYQVWLTYKASVRADFKFILRVEKENNSAADAEVFELRKQVLHLESKLADVASNGRTKNFKSVLSEKRLIDLKDENAKIRKAVKKLTVRIKEVLHQNAGKLPQRYRTCEKKLQQMEVIMDELLLSDVQNVLMVNQK